MWWPENLRPSARSCALAAAMALAGLTAGCFQPLYGDGSLGGSSDLRGKLASVDVPPIDRAERHLARAHQRAPAQQAHLLADRRGRRANPAYQLKISVRPRSSR